MLNCGARVFDGGGRAASYRAGEQWDLHLASMDGSQDVVVAPGEERGFLGFVDWFPDSKRLAYSSAIGHLAIGDICGELSPLTGLPDTEFVGWLYEARFLLHLSPWGDWDLYLGTIGGQSTRLVEFGA